MIFTAASALAVASAQLPAPTFPVFGMANSTCQQWTERKSEPAYRVAQLAYVSGILTGINLGARSNQTGDHDVAFLAGELDRLCLRRPNEAKKVSDILNVVVFMMMVEAYGKGVIPSWPPE